MITDPPYGIDLEYGEYQDSVDNLAALGPKIIELSKQLAILAPNHTSSCSAG